MDSANNNRTFVLVTGASGGIGREIAEVFAKKGNNLVIVARNKNALEEISKKYIELYKVKVYYIPIDLSERESPKFIYEWCIKNNIKISTIINNAGVGLFGEFDKLDLEKQMNMIELNINSLVKLTYYFIPEIKKHSKGYILNVASIAAFYPLPYYSAYGATKAFVLSFTEALRYEMRHTNIAVSCLCPGDTDTNFFNNAGNKNKKRSMIPPKLVAETAVNSLINNKAVIFPGRMKLISKIPRFLLRYIVFRRISKYKL